MQHRDLEVQKAINHLDYALCNYERSTARESVFILRTGDGFVHRSMNGKTVIHDISDEELFSFVS